MKSTIKLFLAYIPLTMSLSGTLSAALLSYDGFESNNFTGGTGWEDAAWSADAQTSVVAKAMSYSSGTVVVNGGTRAVQYAAVNSGSNNSPWLSRSILSETLPVYYSFLIETSNAAGGSNTFLGAYPNRDGATDENANDYGVVMRQNGGATQFGVRSNDGGDQNFVDVDVANNSTQLVIVKLEDLGSQNKMTLWVNPDSDDENSASNLSRSTSMTGGTLFSGSNDVFDSINFRTALLSDEDNYFVDEIRIGTSFAVVVPELGSVLLALMAFIPLFIFRKKANICR